MDESGAYRESLSLLQCICQRALVKGSEARTTGVVVSGIGLGNTLAGKLPLWSRDLRAFCLYRGAMCIILRYLRGKTCWRIPRQRNEPHER